MSDPTLFCNTCQMRYHVMRHQRASDPVGAARKAIKKNPRCNAKCDIQYTAGVDVYGLLRKLNDAKGSKSSY